MNNKKILFISYDGMTDPLGQSQVIPYLAGLTKVGYEFVILSCDKPDKYASQGEYVKKLIEPYPITWVSIPYHKNPPILSSLYDFFKLRQTAEKLQRQYDFGLVHTRVSLPPLVAMYLKKKYGVKFLNDIRGFWADERVDGGMWNLKNPIYRILYKFFRKKEDEYLRVADYNTCLTYRGKEELLKWKNVPQPVKVEVVPCSVDLELFDATKIDEKEKRNLQQELGIHEDDFIISYLGSTGGWYLTNEMLRFCRLLLNKIPHAKFLFISNNKHQEIIDAAAIQNIPAEKVIVKFGVRHQVPTLLSFSAFSLFFIKPCFSKLASSPTKHGEIMAMGIPVITNSGVGDMKEIVEKYDAGYVLDEFTDAAMQKVVDKIAANEKSFNATAIRQGAKEFYNLENTLLTYQKVYEKILGK